MLINIHFIKLCILHASSCVYFHVCLSQTICQYQIFYTQNVCMLWLTQSCTEIVFLLLVVWYCVVARSYSTPSSGASTPRYDYHDDSSYKRMLNPIGGRNLSHTRNAVCQKPFVNSQLFIRWNPSLPNLFTKRSLQLISRLLFVCRCSKGISLFYT